MDVDRVMLPIAFDDHAEMEGDTPKIMHPEPPLRLVMDLPNQALVCKDKDIIIIQNNCGNDNSLIVLKKHEQSSIHM